MLISISASWGPLLFCSLCMHTLYFPIVVYYTLVSYFSLPHPPSIQWSWTTGLGAHLLLLPAHSRLGGTPHLSLYTLGWGCAPLIASSVTVQGVLLPPSLHCSLLGCVGATLIPLRILLGCVTATLIALLRLGCVTATLIAYTLSGVLLPPLFYPRVHPTTFIPIYCQRICILILDHIVKQLSC